MSDAVVDELIGIFTGGKLAPAAETLEPDVEYARLQPFFPQYGRLIVKGTEWDVLSIVKAEGQAVVRLVYGCPAKGADWHAMIMLWGPLQHMNAICQYERACLKRYGDEQGVTFTVEYERWE